MRDLKITGRHLLLLTAFGLITGGAESKSGCSGSTGTPPTPTTPIGQCRDFGVFLTVDPTGNSAGTIADQACIDDDRIRWPLDVTFVDLPSYVTVSFEDGLATFRASPSAPAVTDQVVHYALVFDGRDHYEGKFFVTIQLPPDVVPVVVEKNASGAMITSSPDGIMCGEQCDASFKINETIQLTVTPGAGWQFDGWNGAGCSTAPVSHTGTTHVISLPVPAAGLDCQAQLSPVAGQHLVTLKALLNGNEIRGPIPEGSMIQLVASVDPAEDNMHVHTFQFVHSDQVLSTEANIATAVLNASETFFVKVFDTSTSMPVLLGEAEVSVVAMPTSTELSARCIPVQTCANSNDAVDVDVLVTAGSPNQFQWDLSDTPDNPDLVLNDSRSIRVAPQSPGTSTVIITLTVSSPQVMPYTTTCEVMFDPGC